MPVLGRKDQSSSVYKNRARIPVLERTRQEFQYMYQNRGSILMLGRIRSERQCLQKKVLHFSVEKDKITIPKFNKIGAEFQCLIKKGQISNV